MQLPPVKGCRVFQENDSNPMLTIDMLWRYFEMCELTEVVRQKDPVFVNLLNNCRIGDITDNDINILKSRHIDNFPSYPNDIIHLYAENANVASHNNAMLEKLHTASYSIAAVDKLPPGVSCINSLISNKSQMQLSGLATIFKIKVGALCMVTQNIDLEDRLINGQIGTIVHIKFFDGKPSILYIRFMDDKAGLTLKRTDSYAQNNNCVPIKKVESEVCVRSYRGANVVFKRTQFPLMLSYAATIHKVQGQQFPRALVSFELLKQRNFNAGQMYVSLSRIESLSGLYISGDICKGAIRPDEKALVEYDRLRTKSTMTPIKRFKLLPCNFIFSHLNARSFKCHFEDIESDHILTECDLMLFTETRMKNSISSSYDKIKDFNIYFHDDESDTFRSLAVCYRDTLDFEYIDSIPGLLVFSVRKNTFMSKTFKFILLYKKNCLTHNDFAYMLEHMLSQYQDIDIITGDFNEDSFNMPQNVLSKLISYEQVVTEPTQIDGRILDQIYVNKNAPLDKTCIVKHIHFSDHDATMCKLENRSDHFQI